MSIESPYTTRPEAASNEGDKSLRPDRLQEALPGPADDRSKSNPSLPTSLPEAFGNFAITNSASCKADDKPTITLFNEAKGTSVDKRWCNGNEEYDHADGTVVTFKPDNKGGEIDVHTSPNGSKSTDHARPDGKGGAIVESKNEGNSAEDYTAHYSKDGSMTVDWQNGRHLERYTDEKGVVHTTMTGKEARDNFKATQSADLKETSVQYADGSSFIEKADGKVEAKGRYGGLGIMDAISRSASEFNLTTQWELLNAFWMTQSKIASDVMGGMPK
jgi:hypothetical protein